LAVAFSRIEKCNKYFINKPWRSLITSSAPQTWSHKEFLQVGFMYLKNKFSKISDVKIKEGIFVVPPVRELIREVKFEDQLCEVKKLHKNHSKNHYQFSGKS